MLLWNNKPANPAPVSKSGAGHAKKTVELFVVRVGGQPYGLLLKQIFNIARPEGDMFSVIRSPGPEKGYGEILYQGKVLQVVELARKLQTGPAEALSESKILISGRLVPGGNIQQPFGISVDEIIGVWHIGLEKLRLLDEWVCRKRLGRLIWGIALVDRANYGLQEQAGDVQPTSQFNDMMSETGLLASFNRPDHVGLPEIFSRDEPLRLARAGSVNSGEIPLMLLDLEVLRAELYRY